MKAWFAGVMERVGRSKLWVTGAGIVIATVVDIDLQQGITLAVICFGYQWHQGRVDIEKVKAEAAVALSGRPKAGG